MRNFRRLFSLAVIIMLAGYAYLGWSLARASLSGWLVLAVPVLLILALPLTVWGRDRRVNAHFKDLIAHAAYSAMGILTYLFLFAFLRDAVWLAAGVRVDTV